MSAVTFVATPGPAELIILLVLVGVPLLTVAIILGMVLRGRFRKDLVACPDCGKRMLRTATTCSRCRRPLAVDE